MDRTTPRPLHNRLCGRLLHKTGHKAKEGAHGVSACFIHGRSGRCVCTRCAGGSGQQKSVRRRHRRQWRGTRRGRWGGGPSLRKAEEAGQRVLKQQHLRRNPEERDVYRAAARGDSRSPLKRHRRLCLLRILQRGKATAGKLKTSELHHTPSFQLAPLICGFDGSERTTVP